jgi:hypothetical protein
MSLTQLNVFRHLTLLVLICIFCSCGSTISLFDQYAYQQVTSIKIDAMDLMEQASDSYIVHEKEIKAIDLQIKKVIEYEKHRSQNKITSQMWEKLNDPKGHLYGGFTARWREKKTLNRAFIDAQLMIVSASFDQIAELESGKIKSAEASK